MEYEIEQEGLLFDDSTNPSLKHEEDEGLMLRRRHPEPADKRKLQRGELIPDEEEQQMA